MRHSLVLISALVFAIFSFSTSASAQCFSASNNFMNVGLVPNNPFHADLVTTVNGKLAFFPSGVAHPSRGSIDRDSQGRVRVERIGAKFKMESGPDQGQELEQHLIYICDPVAQTLTQIDTVNRSARISHQARPTALPNKFAPAQLSLCATKTRLGAIANFKTEDLGTQTILGVLAHGIRTTLTPSSVPAEGHSVTTTIRDEWCSEDLAAIVLNSDSFAHESQTFRKSQTSLANLQRTEPDAALFQIPPDYTVSELVPNPSMRRPVFPATGQSVQIPPATPQPQR